MSEKKTATIFDHISGVTDKKTPWSKLSVLDRKSFSVYLVNRWLSMNMDFIEDLVKKHVSGKVIGKVDISRKIYALLMLSLWYNKFIIETE